jgi:predicted nucleic-acid-binding protein
VLAETVFVLQSLYKHSRAEIAQALSLLLNSPGIELENAALHIQALQRYGRTNFHFVDCLVAEFAVMHGVSVATFDSEFKKFTDVRVELG